MLSADGPAWYAEHIMCWEKDTARLKMAAMPAMPSVDGRRKGDLMKSRRNRRLDLDHDDRIDRRYMY